MKAANMPGYVVGVTGAGALGQGIAQVSGQSGGVTIMTAMVANLGCYRAEIGLQDISGEDRYRPTLWLKRRAALGLPIHTPS